MKTQGFTCFARKATKPLPCLHFTFIQQTLIKQPIRTIDRILDNNERALMPVA